MKIGIKNKTLNVLRLTLRSLLGWVNRELDHSASETPRKGRKPFYLQEVHIPVPLVIVVCAMTLFVVLLPEVGLSWPRVFGLAGLVTLLTLFFIIYLRYDLPQLSNDDEGVFLSGLCLILGVVLIELVRSLKPYPDFAIPIGAIAIIATLLLHHRLALLLSVVLSVVAGVFHNFSFNVMLVCFFSSTAATLACYHARRRADIMKAGLHVMWVTAVAIFGIGLFGGWTWKAILPEVVYAAPFNAMLSAGIPLIVLPILEFLFSKVTNITLLELGDFNRPLLRRLMIESPGTYHHTLLVAALAEQAAEAIGANSLLCRVGMYYHDVGKLAHPEYFIENQTMRRSAKEKAAHHDKLNPSISGLVILSHVKEGQILAKTYDLPDEILKFIPEHHGTSLIKYFYVRALEQDEDQGPPAEESFRYPGPKPQSKETVIGMLADSVEAASRTLEEPTYERLKDLVEKIVESKLTDGQFDQSPITLADLRKIINSFAHSLSAIYHVRIEYPELNEQESD